MDDIRVRRRRARWARRCVVWIALVTVALPVRAQQSTLVDIEREVQAIVQRAKPSVVSVRVGPRRAGRPVIVPKKGTRPAVKLTPAPNGKKDDAPVIVSPDGELIPGAAGDQLELVAETAVAADIHFETDGALRALIQPSRVGTGFVIDRDGIILTTADVVGNGDQVRVTFSDGRDMDGKVLGADASSGVAVVKVERTDLPALKLAEEDRAAQGQWAIIVGNQLDKSHSVWLGTVARTDVTLDTAATGLQGKLLQIHAPVGAGASGAPVFNSRGEVIGVVVAASNPWLRVGEAGGDAFGKEMAVWGEKFGQSMAEWGKNFENNPEFERRVKELERAAERLGEKAAKGAEKLKQQQEQQQRKGAKGAPESEAERKKREAEFERRMERFEKELEERVEAASERLEKAAERLGEKTEQRAELLAERQALAAQPGAEDAAKREAELRRLDERIKRMDAELKREQEVFQKENQRFQQELQRELGKLNTHLPDVPGVREFVVELTPEIAKVVTEAQAIAQSAVGAALVAPPVPPTPPAPGAPAAPASPDAPPALLAEAAVKGGPFWAGRGGGEGGVTYALPASRVRWAAAQIRERGRVAHPHLGVALADLKPEERERLKAPEAARVRVDAVMPDSPAAAAGLQKDDLILEFQGRRLEDASDMQELMRETRVGEQVTLTIWRGGERRSMQVTTRERPPRPNPRPVPFVVPNPPRQPRAPRPPRIVVPGNPPARRFAFAFPPGRVIVRAEGTGRNARVTLEAQDAELEAVFQELSRATGLRFTADGDAERRRVTLKVEDVPVADLVESLERLYRLQSSRQGDRYTFRVR